MDSQPTPDTIKIQEISFPNGNQALTVIPPHGSPATHLVRALGIPQPRSLVMIAGEVLYNVRQSRPIIIIEGSGRLADEVVEVLHNACALDSDLNLTEIMNQGKLHVFPITGSTAELEQLIQRLFDEQ